MLSMLRDPMLEVLDDVMGSAFGGSTAVRSFAPAIDVRADEEGLHLDIDVPGVKLGDLDIVCEHNVLTVAGHRRFGAHESKQSIVLGRGYGKFSRAFAIPDWADGEKVDAKLEDGVLTISIPRRESARPRKVSVRAQGPAAQLAENNDEG